MDYYSNNCALIISISHNLHDIQRTFTLQEFHVKFLCAFYDKFLSYAIFKWNEKLLHLHSYMKLTSISLENDISLLFYHDFFSCINIQLYTNNIQLLFNAHNWFNLWKQIILISLKIKTKMRCELEPIS